MKIWLVEAGMDYDGTFATAVCSTKEKADRLVAEWEADTSYDWITASPHTVDGHEPDYSSFT